MINKNELIFAVDENNNPIEPAERWKAHAEGIWHRSSDIAVVNSKKEILCNKRSLQKDHSPGMWDGTFGGHTLAGQDSLAGAKQELLEESGLAADKLEFVAIVKYVDRNDTNKEFRYLYVYRWDGDLKELKLEAAEIDEAKWFPLHTLVENKDNRQQWSPMPYLDELLAYI